MGNDRISGKAVLEFVVSDSLMPQYPASDLAIEGALRLINCVLSNLFTLTCAAADARAL